MRVTLLALLLGLVLAAPAPAAFHGSNGKVAYMASGGALMVDDPFDDEPAGAIADAATFEKSALSPESPPAWSPDGTKIAFTRAVDNGNVPYEHSAVFVANVDGTGLQQVSQPFPGKLPSCGICDDGESAWDVQPTWRDDDTLAFIRWVAADDDAQHESQEGTTVIRAELAGGETPMRHYPNENNEAAMGLIWPNTWSEPLIIHGEGSGLSLRKVVSNQTIASGLISDFDASPDGQKIAYASASPAGFRVVTITASGAPVDSFTPGFVTQPAVRFTPDNNGLLLQGCAKDGDGLQHCGLVTHRLPDPEADVRPGEPVEASYLPLDMTKLETTNSVGTRSLIDIQSQDLPVIYVPGFLGSEIECAGDRVWMPSAPPLRFHDMQLQDDGLTNKTCPSAKPTGKMVATFLNFDVYEHGDKWLAKMNPAGGYASFGWDWRKPPQESLDELDALIDKLLTKELLVAQGANRVSLVGHSYGALLMRTYIDDEARSKRVARMLTVGAPYWGSPKPLFSIAFGTELPSFSSIDMMADNDDLRAFARNMPGAYHLMPSDNYGPWLRFEGDQLDQAGVANWIKAGAGGNEGLLQQAWATHREHIDGFEDHAGRIDYRSVTGVGFLTIGGVDLVDLAAEGDGLTAKVRYENGDGTVTARSATQGPVGTLDPLGDDISIQYRCGYAHMDQTKDQATQLAYTQFLIDGRLPRKLPPADCTPEGEEIEVFEELEVDLPAAGDSGRAAGPMTLAEAELAGLVDVVRLPGRTLIVKDEANPVDVTFQAQGTSFGVTQLTGTERGQQKLVPPVTGTVRLGGDGTITVDGQPVTPAEPEATPTPSATPSPSATPTATATAVPTATPAANDCAAKLTMAKQALAKAKKAARKRPSAKNRKRVAKAKKALALAKRC